MKKALGIVVAVLVAVSAFAESTNITGSLMIRQQLLNTFTDDLGIQTVEQLTSNAVWAVTSGKTSGKFEAIWSAKMTLTESATQSYDLSGGLTNRFGKPINFSSVKWIQLGAGSGNSGTISMGNGLAHWASLIGGTNQSIKIRPGAQVIFMAPQTNSYSVTATTGDILKFKNDATAYTNTLTVFIGGTVL